MEDEVIVEFAEPSSLYGLSDSLSPTHTPSFLPRLLRSSKDKKFNKQSLNILIRLKNRMEIEPNNSSQTNNITTTATTAAAAAGAVSAVGGAVGAGAGAATTTKNPMILTIGLVKILCDRDINTKFFEKCQILFTSQHNLHEENLNQQEGVNIVIPSNKSFYKKTIIPEIFVIIFHLGNEVQPPPSIAHNALQSMKSRQNSSQFFVAELLPHQLFRNLRSKPYPFFQARKSFNPILANKLVEFQLKIPIKKVSRGRKSNSSGGGFLAEQGFEIMIQWSDEVSSTVTQQNGPSRQHPVNVNHPFSNIFYHFTTQNGSTKVESYEYIKCPWCRYPHRRSHTQTTALTIPHSDECRLPTHASAAQCNAILTWSNLDFAGGRPFLPTDKNAGGNKSKSPKRKFDQSTQQNRFDTDYFQFPSSVIWSSSTRESLRALLIHLNTVHSHFQYQYFCDRLLNLHIIVSKTQSTQCVLSSDTVNNSTRRASSSTSRKNSIRSQTIPAHPGNFLFYGKSWRNLFTEDFPIVIVKSLSCDYAVTRPISPTAIVGTTNELFTSSNDTIDQHSSLIPRNETISLIENSYLLQEELKPMTSASPPTLHPPLLSSSSIPNEDITCLTSSNSMSRQYFHSNGFPIEPTEGQYDSDNDINTTWEHVHSYDLIEEFQDICHLEKKFMIIWNTFINSFPVYADRYMCVALEIFSKRFGSYIVQHGLRHIFLLHLMTLWDFSLVTFNALVKSLELVDQYHENYLQSTARDNESKSLEL